MDATLANGFGEVVHTCGRGEAISEGTLVDLTGLFPEVCERHYPGYPVACTAAVWQRLELATEAPMLFNDLSGVVHQLLWASRHAQTEAVDDATRLFLVVLGSAGRPEELRIHWGPGDRDEPVLTVTLPEED